MPPTSGAEGPAWGLGAAQAPARMSEYWTEPTACSLVWVVGSCAPRGGPRQPVRLWWPSKARTSQRAHTNAARWMRSASCPPPGRPPGRGGFNIELKPRFRLALVRVLMGWPCFRGGLAAIGQRSRGPLARYLYPPISQAVGRYRFLHWGKRRRNTPKLPGRPGGRAALNPKGDS